MVFLYIYIASVAISFIIALIINRSSSSARSVDDSVINIYRMRIWELVVLCILFGLIMPFDFLSIFIQKLYYKKHPRPISRKIRDLCQKDAVYDENNCFMSLSEYNFRHGTSFSLDQVYGKGYESSLTDEERAKINNSQSGVVNVPDSILNDSYTLYAKELGEAIISGDFSVWASCLSDNVELIIYKSKTIVGVNDVVDYWKGWRERNFLTYKVCTFNVVHSNYYSHSCLQMATMLLAMNIKDGKVNKMIFSLRHIAGGYYSYHDDLVADEPFTYSYIKKYLKPMDETESVEKANRIPCVSCGVPSEDLEWHSSMIAMGIHGYPAQVSICPKCGKVIEYCTVGRIRFEEPVIDESDSSEDLENNDF